jgi:hypothetical protein
LGVDEAQRATCRIDAVSWREREEARVMLLSMV